MPEEPLVVLLNGFLMGLLFHCLCKKRCVFEPLGTAISSASISGFFPQVNMREKSFTAKGYVDTLQGNTFSTIGASEDVLFRPVLSL